MGRLGKEVFKELVVDLLKEAGEKALPSDKDMTRFTLTWTSPTRWTRTGAGGLYSMVKSGMHGLSRLACRRTCRLQQEALVVQEKAGAKVDCGGGEGAPRFFEGVAEEEELVVEGEEGRTGHGVGGGIVVGGDRGR